MNGNCQGAYAVKHTAVRSHTVISTFGATNFSIITLSITTFSVTALSIGGLFVTLSINDAQHNNTL